MYRSSQILTLAILAILSFGGVQAAVVFGSQVESGDGDFIQTTAITSVAFGGRVLHKDLGVTGDIQDDAFYLDTDGSGTVTTFDVRLTAYGGKAVGSFVADSDTVEKGTAKVAGAGTEGYAIVASTAIKFWDQGTAGADITSDAFYLKDGANTIATIVQDGDHRLRDPTLAAGVVANGEADDEIDIGDVTAGIGVDTGGKYYEEKGPTNGQVDAGDVRWTAVGTFTAGSTVDCGTDADCATVITAVPSAKSDSATPTLGTNGLWLDANSNSVVDVGETRINYKTEAVETAVVAGNSDAPRAIADTPATVKYYETGATAGLSSNDYFYIDSGTVAGKVDAGDVRITTTNGGAAASTVVGTDADATAVVTNAARVVYADVNNNGRYDTGDYVYFTTSSSGALAPSSGSSFTLRLTAAGGQAAGTLVFASDNDMTQYGSSVISLSSAASYSFYDTDKSATFNTGDHAYLLNAAPGSTAGQSFALYSVRLSAGNPAGAFGSQVAKGAADFVEGLTAGVNIDVVRKALGDTQVTDDCLYWDALATGGANSVDTFDIRLTPCQGKAAGSQVADGDTIEKGTAVPEVVGVVFADVNNNGRYDTGDYLYLGQASAGTAITTALAATTSTDQFTIRLTATPSGAAGTYVFANDADFTSYGSAVSTDFDGSGGASTGDVEFSYYDADASSSFNSGDVAYAILQEGTGTFGGGFVPLGSLRLSGTFGSVVGQSDADFIATLTLLGDAEAGDNDIVRKALGDAQVTDDCVYVNIAGAANSVDTFEVRLKECVGKAPGSLVNDGDTIEKGAATAETSANLKFLVADINNNGRYDFGDDVFLVRSANAANDDLVATTSATEWTLRLTATASGAAGTFVFASDSDFTSYASAATDDGAFNIAWNLAYFDADRSSSFSAADTLYLAAGTVTTGSLIPQFSLRLAGEIVSSGGSNPSSPVTPPAEPPVTPEVPPVAPEEPPVTPPAEPPVTPEDEDEDDTTTPGFELVALVAALGAAMVLVRRRK